MEYDKTYYEENKERIASIAHEYYEKNKEKIIENHKKYIAENKESFWHTFESTFAPYDIYSHVGDNHTFKCWIGFTLGIRFDKK